MKTSIHDELKAILPDAEVIEKYFDRLWPICRSLTGNGVRETLRILQELLPLNIIEIPSGTKVFDWTIPNEWNIEDGWIENEEGIKIAHFKNNNLHILGYSTPIDQWMSLDELNKNLFSIPEQPEAIPYLTSYYKERWGFCLSHNERQNLKPGKYRAVIKANLSPGHLTFGHVVLPATIETDKEILLSCNICHPSLANNELSGPLMVAFLYQSLLKMERREVNYRFVFLPETIGAVAYLKEYGEHLKKNCIGGFTLTCVGDNRHFNFKKTRDGNTFVDRAAISVLKNHNKPHSIIDFFPSGSDERQYCSPGFNLAVGSIFRSAYGVNGFPEYHTSLDNKSIMSFEGMVELISIYLQTFLSLERNRSYINTMPFCEPMLSPRGLYTTLGSSKTMDLFVERMMWVLNYSDGKYDLQDIAEKAQCTVADLSLIADVLEEKGLLKRIE